MEFQKLGQLKIQEENNQNQNFADRNTESFVLQSDDADGNPWSKKQSDAQSPSTVLSENEKKPVSNVYVPPSVIKGEVSELSFLELLIQFSIYL